MKQGKVIGHLTDQERKLKASRSSGSLMAVVESLLLLTKCKKATVYSEDLELAEASPQYLHED